MIATFSVSQLLLPGLAIFIFVAFFLTLKVMMSRYQKIPPNKVAIIYGRRSRSKSATGESQIEGCRVVSGGGVMVWPVIEEMTTMDTAVFQVRIQEDKIPNAENVPISVVGVATCKISTETSDLKAAAAAFLGQAKEQIQETIKAVLIGHVRSIIGKLDINGILRDRDKFNSMVVEESSGELKQMGIAIVTLVIQDVHDEHGYIESLGKRAVADAKRDADIRVAQAEAETRQQISEAQKKASIVEAENAALVASAQKDLAVKQARYKAEADTELANANQALAIATAAQQQTLVVAEADRDAAQAEARIKVQEKEAQRMEKELQVTKIRPAQAEAEAAVIEAEGKRKAAVIGAEAQKEVKLRTAEADKEVQLRNAEAQAVATERIGQGNAKRTQVEMEAEAAGNRAKLMAQAEGDKANLLAQADGERAKQLAIAAGQAAQKGDVLLAEAKGTEAMAVALAKMNDAAKLILILDRAAPLINAGGEAGAKILQAMFGPIGQGVSQIDSIHITDFGGSAKGAGQVADIVPNAVFQVLAGLKARGVDLAAVGKFLGIDLSALGKMLESGGAPASAEPTKAS